VLFCPRHQLTSSGFEYRIDRLQNDLDNKVPILTKKSHDTSFYFVVHHRTYSVHLFNHRTRYKPTVQLMTPVSQSYQVMWRVAFIMKLGVLYTMYVHTTFVDKLMDGQKDGWMGRHVVKIWYGVKMFRLIKEHGVIINGVRFQVFTAVKLWIELLWVVTRCSLVGGYQRFAGTYRFHLQSRRRMEAIHSSKMLVTHQKIFMGCSYNVQDSLFIYLKCLSSFWVYRTPADAISLYLSIFIQTDDDQIKYTQLKYDL
jgi:hypothetical protein